MAANKFQRMYKFSGRIDDQTRFEFGEWLLRLLNEKLHMSPEEVRLHARIHPRWKEYERIAAQPKTGHDCDIMWTMVVLRRYGYLIRIGDQNKWYRHAITPKGMKGMDCTPDELINFYQYTRHNKHLVGKKGGALTPDEESLLRIQYIKFRIA